MNPDTDQRLVMNLLPEHGKVQIVVEAEITLVDGMDLRWEGN